ncbi:MAG: hypothetical protein MN733_13625 [Nitrososphaera sp.]|nr:hypothetical protein [Nitrososphaera sp.]
MTKEELFNKEVSYAKPNCGLDYYWAQNAANLHIESTCKGNGPSDGFKRWLTKDEFPITYDKIVGAALEFGVSKEEIDQCLAQRLETYKQSIKEINE